MKNKIVTCIVLATIAFLISIVGAFAQAKSTFAGDINVLPASGIEYGNARITVAYNGDVYVGRLLRSPGGEYKTWEVLKSTDGGTTFTQFSTNFILVTDVYYSAFDIVACGNTPADFRLFVVRATHNHTTGDASITLTSHTAANVSNTIALGASSYQGPLGRAYVSIALSTDSKEPALDSSPFSVSVAAVKADAVDSVVLWTDMTGGSQMNRRSLYGTIGYIRNVSASTGTAQSSVHGRLGVTWDEYDSGIAEWGNIKAHFVYTDDGQDANFSGPYDVSTQNMHHRKPAIAMSNNNAVQDITGSIILEYDASSTSEGANIYSRTFDQLILGTPQFESVTVQIGNDDQIDPHVSYNPANNKFLYTYYNAANYALVYKTADLSVDIQAIPIMMTVNYRDAQSVMTDPMPRIDGRTDSRNFFVWNDNFQTFFDGQINWPASVQNTSVSVADMKLYPNPATDNITLSFTAEENDKATLSIIDMSGRILQNTEAAITKGSNKLPIALNNLPTGNYTLRISGEHTNTAVMFTVQH